MYIKEGLPIFSNGDKIACLPHALFAPNACIGTTQSPPTVQQTMQHVQQFDQQHAQMMSEMQAQNTQVNTQAQQGSMPSGR